MGVTVESFKVVNATAADLAALSHALNYILSILLVDISSRSE
jgi:hypothetical protein